MRTSQNSGSLVETDPNVLQIVSCTGFHGVEYRVPKWRHGHQAYLSSAGLGLKAQLYRALREPRDQLSRASGTPIVSPRGIQSLVPSSVTV